jgi:predicted transcriptional regulator of viral defense system
MSPPRTIKSSTKAIALLLEKEDSSVWNDESLVQILLSNEEWKTGNTSIDQDIVPYLIQEGVLHIVNISSSKSSTTRYVSPSARPEEILLSIRPGSYLSHYTAMSLHGITNSIPKMLYSNLEQFKPAPNKRTELVQINIDKAFSKPMRVSSNIASFEFLEKVYEGTLLTGNKSSNLGVGSIKAAGRLLPATDLERTLIDAAVRPVYCGGVQEVLSAYKMSKDSISVKKILSYLTSLDFTYPYIQVIGFYLEKSNISEKALKEIEKGISQFEFYLTYEMRKKSFSKRWRVYYPSELDDCED